MQIHILQVPYDSGHRSTRMGAGPENLVQNGLPDLLRANGHTVTVETIEPQTAFRAEVKTQFELYRLLATRVAAVREQNSFPLILSGNCGASLGAIAGNPGRGVFWLDAHGEFNTPETTRSGFLDGMGLAIATGRCWTKLAESIPGFRPIPGESILLIGGRDFDPGEYESLEQVGATVKEAVLFETASTRAALQEPLSTLARRFREAHLHIDLDVLNPQVTPANEFMNDSRGLHVAQVHEMIGLLKDNLKITSATVASYDPAYDPAGKTRQAAFQLVRQIVEE